MARAERAGSSGSHVAGAVLHGTGPLARAARWPRPVLVELFAIANLAFLTLDVFLAHSVNAFHYAIERIPVGFGALGAVVLLTGLIVDAFDLRRVGARSAGFVVGWAAIVVGVIGLFLHLRSSFFEQQTLKNLVYTAPFVAPLSFAGLGFLVLVNRQVPRGSLAWGRWVLFLAWGGFVGNFVLSLADHAQNGFYDRLEWVPVFAAALAVAFLFVALVRPADVALRRASFAVLALEIVVGVAGFALHVIADLRPQGAGFVEGILYGAPPFAPLLFADLAALAALALWDLGAKTAAVPVGSAGD
jgi:hypothetical protein